MEACLGQSCALAASGTSSGLLFIELVRALLGAQCALNVDNIYPEDRTTELLDENLEFDFIIVGGGTAGSVVASRLSEVNNWKILLIEEGKNPSTMSRIPIMLLALQHTEEDYKYQLEPNENYCQGMKEKICHWSKGKALGGSSVTNAMLHVHGNDRDYNHWAKMGNDGWSYEEILPYFRKSESYNAEFAARLGSKYFGTNGPLPIRKFNHSSNFMSNLIMQAARELGIPTLETFNGKDYVGYGEADGTLDNGLRVNAAEAFLAPVKDRKNLYIIKSARGQEILMSGKKATGVRVKLNNNQIIDVRATKEVILSAGTIETPQLLMLSGIGPKKHLAEFGIKNLVDLQVGQNLQDHALSFGVQIVFENKTGQEWKISDFFLDSSYDFLMHRKGELAATGGIDLLGFLNTDDLSAKYPNIEFHHAHFPRGKVLPLDTMLNAFGASDDLKNQLLEEASTKDLLFFLMTTLNPKSIGEVKLQSNNPNDRVKIIPNYLKHSDDVNTLLKGIEFLRSLINTKAMQSIGVKWNKYDIPNCRNMEFDTDDYWKCNFKHTYNTVYHAVGTAKMGPKSDEKAVVDPRLKVHGIERLRVIDASIMPKIPSANINSATLMIAEKGSDMIKEDWTERDEL
ncbi:glucose dehydrogenase [FAD, quinone]-like [Leptopilina boulardi]|uniref:glucose dehydrogenase [FAD, quinone]-like n=1 Tax=Leptopilina boulardi TaxID=63433 RepID=UPI0021F5F1E9|nr:glucose dehydrogenase [FAD, quinone]-like [Leptopilina boulardi]